VIYRSKKHTEQEQAEQEQANNEHLVHEHLADGGYLSLDDIDRAAERRGLV
jgi:hypothetical protein